MMDMAYLEKNFGKQSSVLLNTFEKTLGIEVSEGNRERYMAMMQRREDLLQRKRNDTYKRRKRNLRTEAIKVNHQRTLKYADIRAQYKQKSNEELVSSLFF